MQCDGKVQEPFGRNDFIGFHLPVMEGYYPLLKSARAGAKAGGWSLPLRWWSSIKLERYANEAGSIPHHQANALRQVSTKERSV